MPEKIKIDWSRPIEWNPPLPGTEAYPARYIGKRRTYTCEVRMIIVNEGSQEVLIEVDEYGVSPYSADRVSIKNVSLYAEKWIAVWLRKDKPFIEVGAYNSQEAMERDKENRKDHYTLLNTDYIKHKVE